MLILFYLLNIIVGIGATIGLYFLLKKSSNKNKILKIISVSLYIIAFVRYLLENEALADTRGLNMYSPFGDDMISTSFSMILVWFTYASITLVALYPFFNVKNIKNLIKFIAVPTVLLDVIFFKTYAIGIIGSEAFTKFDFRIVLLSIEIIVLIAYLFNEFVKKDYFKLDKKEIKNLLITVIPVLIAIMPGYTLQLFFGYTNNIYLKFDQFTFEHRLILYSSIILPTSIYFALKNKSEEIRRFSILYFSLSVLWTFMIRFPIPDLIENPSNWPLHLCHTAMYIVPLCIIFKWERLFYFTFFINVMGAFIAMIVPSTDANILSSGVVRFWVNHMCAFFMPVLVILLGLFKRPRLKQWINSMIAFCAYFVLVLILNAWFSNYGEVDFFYLNSDFIAAQLGNWAEDMRETTFSFNIGKLNFTFYPIYQALFFVVYAFISLGLWFIYEQLFQIVDLNEDRIAKEKEYQQIKKELAILLEGRSEDEPMSGDSKPCLELKSFSKKYGTNKHYSVKDASFKVNGGEIFGFLGPNGAGKSTIIKSIVGIQTITSGNIEVCGYDVKAQAVQAKRQIGFVPDHYALYENLTGREYINYIADLYEISNEERNERIEKYVNNFELKGAFDNQMKTYSHGMKQKIAIMAALVHNPKVWILDEPLTGLDPTSIYQVKESMKEHAKAGNIVFFSSHIIDVVEKICDRIAIIKKGTILCDVKVKDLDKKKISLEQFYLDNINEVKVSEEANGE